MPTGLAVHGIGKRFGGVHALKGVDATFRPGEVHGLLGENGAGKSTLIAISSGALSPDTGNLTLGSTELQLSSPHEATLRGISVVHQEPALTEQMSILRNVFLPRLAKSPLLKPFRVETL